MKCILRILLGHAVVEYGKDRYPTFSRGLHRPPERVELDRCAIMRGEGILGSEVIEFKLNGRIGQDEGK